MVRARVLALLSAADHRGLLSAAQVPDQLPFAPQRVFVVSQSPEGTVRGGHAHRSCHQILVAAAGTVIIEYDDHRGTSSLILSDASHALHVPPLVWAKQTYVSEGASLVVLASHPYDVNDYIDDRQEAAHLRSQVTGIS